MNILKKLYTAFNRFCYQNRDKGIPNLMLYIVLGNAVVIIMSMINGGAFLYNALCFDKAKILQGQVWRLVTYVFTQSGSSLLELLFLYFFYMLGRHVESSMGTLKFNLFYLSGVVLMDIFAMIFCPIVPEVITTQEQFSFLSQTVPVYMNMAYYLHLSLVLMFATTHPDAQFLILFIIPIKAWVMALIYLLLIAVEIFNLSYPAFYFPHNLFPLVALGNYFLFTGKDIANLLPLSLRAKRFHKANKQKPQGGPIPFRQPAKKPDYQHRCTICGRTNITDPQLEFRYCSRCNGYHCYCEDHISNHTHIE